MMREMLPAPLLTDPPFVLALLWLARALGRRLCGPLSDLLSLAVGLGVLPFVFFGLGLFGLARPLPLLLALLGLALWARRELFAPLPGLRLPRAPLEWCLWGALLIYLPFAAAPVTDHDGQFYHLTIPKRWLATGHLDYLPTLTMSQWPLGVELLFGLCLALWSDTGAKLLHFALGVLALLTLAQLGERLGKRGAGLLAGALLIVLARGEFGAAYVDLGIAFQTAAALLAFVEAQQTGERKLWLLTGLLSGFAASFKLTGVFLGLALFVVSGPRAPRDRVLFVLLALAPLVPFLLRAWWLTGNPFYPNLAMIFPSRDWSPVLSEVFLRFHQLYNWGSGHNGSARERDALRGGLVLLALVGGFLGRKLPYRLGLVLASLLAITLALTGPYPRYLIPLLPIASLLALLPLRSLRLALWLGSLVVVGVALPSLRTLPTVLPAALGGRHQREHYLNQQLSLYPVLVWLNHTTSPDARLLLVADTAYYSDRPCWLPHPYLQGAIRLTRYSDFAADVKQARLTHIVLGRDEPSGLGLFPTENQWRFSQQLAHEHGTLIFQNAELEVWRLSNPSRSL